VKSSTGSSIQSIHGIGAPGCGRVNRRGVPTCGLWASARSPPQLEQRGFRRRCSAMRRSSRGRPLGRRHGYQGGCDIDDDMVEHSPQWPRAICPPNVTTLPGQTGVTHHSEGTAMLNWFIAWRPELSFISPRVDPTRIRWPQTSWLSPPRGGGQKHRGRRGPVGGPVSGGWPAAMAVQTVSDQGVLYFSSAGNNGNADSGNRAPGKRFRGWGAVGRRSPRRTSPGTAPSQAGAHSAAGRITTWWPPMTADRALRCGGRTRWGHLRMITNLFLLDGSGSVLWRRATPPTCVPVPGRANSYECKQRLPGGGREVFRMTIGSCTWRWPSFPTALNTAGNVIGHNCFQRGPCVLRGGHPGQHSESSGGPTGPYPNPFTGGAANQVEYFSSDGRGASLQPQRHADYARQLFLAGGRVISNRIHRRPTAGDNLAAYGDGLTPFFGTSCAAASCGCNAALLLSIIRPLNRHGAHGPHNTACL